jgi:3'(2'), 5'-bisphosphate nucleotidase
MEDTIKVYGIVKTLMIRNRDLLSTSIIIAKNAGTQILEWYQDIPSQVVRKSDTSPLTEADLVSNAYIVSSLSSTGIPVISEEAECAYEVRKDWHEFWLVDPLDGTKDFLERNGEFTVNIALIEDGSPIIGVIHAPAINLTYFAHKGNGAFCDNGSKVRQLPCFESLEQPVATVSRQHLSTKTLEFLKINEIYKFKRKGSSLKFGTVASGKATLYPRFEGSMEWDIAAGHIILTEAGCRITDLETGSEPEYNKLSLHNNPFIVSSPYINIKTLSMPEINSSRLR